MDTFSVVSLLLDSVNSKLMEKDLIFIVMSDVIKMLCNL